MTVADGPLYEGKKTCVAALVMQDNPSLAQYYPFHTPNQPYVAHGGLYCIDMQGNIVSSDESLTGLYTSLCSLSDYVIGITYEDKQWQLWRWYPFRAEAQRAFIHLDISIRRATVIFQETEEGNWFWCAEEYEGGIRVTQRICDTF